MLIIFITVRTNPSSSRLDRRLVLMMFDCKLKSVYKGALSKAGQNFADEILIKLYQNNPTKMKVIVSVPNFTLKNFIRGILTRLRSRQPSIEAKIGFEISEDSTYTQPNQHEQQFRELGVAAGHAWLSSGISSFVLTWNEANLRKEVNYRNNGNYFSKVYTWTVDKTSSAKWYLNLNLDGIITNNPGNVNKAIQQVNSERSADKKIRLATLDDNPFEVYQNKKN